MQRDRKEGLGIELEATGVKPKGTKSRKTLFSNSRTDKYMFGRLIFKSNETRIKVLSSYPSGHVEVRSPRGQIKKKNISVIENISLML